MAQRIKRAMQIGGRGVIDAAQQANEMRAQADRARLAHSAQQGALDRAAKERSQLKQQEFALDIALQKIFAQKEAAQLRMGHEKEAQQTRIDAEESAAEAAAKNRMGLEEFKYKLGFEERERGFQEQKRATQERESIAGRQLEEQVRQGDIKQGMRDDARTAAEAAAGESQRRYEKAESDKERAEIERLADKDEQKQRDKEDREREAAERDLKAQTAALDKSMPLLESLQTRVTNVFPKGELEEIRSGRKDPTKDQIDVLHRILKDTLESVGLMVEPEHRKWVEGQVSMLAGKYINDIIKRPHAEGVQQKEHAKSWTNLKNLGMMAMFPGEVLGRDLWDKVLRPGWEGPKAVDREGMAAPLVKTIEEYRNK